MSTEPSRLKLNLFRSLSVWRLSRFSTKKYSALYMVNDQKPFTGGILPFSKCKIYLLAPFNRCPLPSVWVSG